MRFTGPVVELIAHAHFVLNWQFKAAADWMVLNQADKNWHLTFKKDVA